MRRRIDRLLLVIACVLGTGGWLCQSDGDNRCPGALTCDVEIANVCCPYDSFYYCDGCSESPCVAQKTHLCEDDAHILACSFDATIISATCDAPVSTPEGVAYALNVKGRLSGCGQEAALFTLTPGDASKATVDCGSWDDGVFGGCVSPSPQTTSTDWTFHLDVPAGTVQLDIKRAHGTAPALATMSIACGGS